MHGLTYLLTPWSRVLLEKLTGLQLVKKFSAFYETRTFITAFTSARHLSLSWTSSIQSTHRHPTSRRSILILSTHLCLGLPSGLLLSGYPTKTLYTLYPPPYVCLLRDASSRNTPPPRRSEWGSNLPPDCFVSRGSMMHGLTNFKSVGKYGVGKYILSDCGSELSRHFVRLSLCITSTFCWTFHGK